MLQRFFNVPEIVPSEWNEAEHELLSEHLKSGIDRENSPSAAPEVAGARSDESFMVALHSATLPSIVMMIFTSLYSVVDGLFVSNLVGDLALSAVNIAFPITMIIGAFGFMLGTGGSAIVARTLGEGKPELASRYFSLFIWCVAGLGVVLSIVTIAFIEPIMRFAGASDLLLPDCIAYGRILLAGSAVFMLQSAFQSFFSAAEKPKLGLLLSLAAGATNIVFDYVFIALLDMGVVGAALATVLGYCVGGVIPVVYFLMPRREGLRLVRTRFYGRQLLHACTNGSSELMSNISSSVVGILYNIQLMDLIGEKRRKDLFPVGRLDKDTEGLLLITNDGELAHRLLSPKKHVDKTYYARVAGRITEEHKKIFAAGVDIGDEKPALPAELRILSSEEISEVELTIHEGRFHQVKRMFHAVGGEVLYLKRTSMGSLRLDECLEPGQYRRLTEDEIRALC